MAKQGLALTRIKTLTLLAVVEPGSPAESSLLSILDAHGAEPA